MFSIVSVVPFLFLHVYSNLGLQFSQNFSTGNILQFLRFTFRWKPAWWLISRKFFFLIKSPLIFIFLYVYRVLIKGVSIILSVAWGWFMMLISLINTLIHLIWIRWIIGFLYHLYLLCMGSFHLWLIGQHYLLHFSIFSFEELTFPLFLPQLCHKLVDCIFQCPD